MNDQQLKDELDFMCEEPAHYPPGLQRFNLGKNHVFFLLCNSKTYTI
jgi:hypothetical protein